MEKSAPLQQSPRIVPLDDLESRSTGGGKAFRLAELRRAGLPVPNGAVLPPSVLAGAIGDDAAWTEQMARLAAATSLDEGHAIARSIREHIAAWQIPSGLVSELESTFESLRSESGCGCVVVRSSAVDEDGDAHSFAGVHESFLHNATGDQCLASIRACWASVFSREALTYRHERGLSLAGAGAILLQVQVKPDLAGVLFTAHPSTGDTASLVAEVVRGYADAFVAGEENATAVTLPRQPPSAPEHLPPGCPLSHAEVGALRDVVSQVEAAFGPGPWDIEWGLVASRPVVFQVRPITTFSAVDGLAPVPPLMRGLFEGVLSRLLLDIMIREVNHGLGEKVLLPLDGTGPVALESFIRATDVSPALARTALEPVTPVCGQEEWTLTDRLTLLRLRSRDDRDAFTAVTQAGAKLRRLAREGYHWSAPDPLEIVEATLGHLAEYLRTVAYPCMVLGPVWLGIYLNLRERWGIEGDPLLPLLPGSFPPAAYLEAVQDLAKAWKAAEDDWETFAASQRSQLDALETEWGSLIAAERTFVESGEEFGSSVQRLLEIASGRSFQQRYLAAWERVRRDSAPSPPAFNGLLGSQRRQTYLHVRQQARYALQGILEGRWFLSEGMAALSRSLSGWAATVPGVDVADLLRCDLDDLLSALTKQTAPDPAGRSWSPSPPPPRLCRTFAASPQEVTGTLEWETSPRGCYVLLGRRVLPWCDLPALETPSGVLVGDAFPFGFGAVMARVLEKPFASVPASFLENRRRLVHLNGTTGEVTAYDHQADNSD